MGKMTEAVKEYNEMLQKHIAKKHRVKLSRKFRSGDESIFGYLLKMSDDMLLLQVESEFDMNGYCIMPIWAFDSLRFSKWDRATTRIMKGEGILPKMEYDIDITGWQEVFTGLKQLDKHVGVACENKKEDTFYIGAIEKVGKKSVQIRNFDPAGVLDEEATNIKYEDITTLTFDNRYSNIFRKYLKEKKVKKAKVKVQK